MGKLTSIIFGIIVTELLVYYVISSEYSTIVNWFGPVFGFRIIIVLGYLALFFGNPLGYATIAGSWVLVGFIVALGSRRTLRSIGSAVSVFAIALLMFGLAVYSFIAPGSAGGLSTSFLNNPLASSFPPPPSGSSVGQVLSAPVISSVVNLFGSFISGLGITSGSTGTSGASLTSIASSLLGPLVGNFIILIVSAGLFGYMFSRLTGNHAKISKKNTGNTTVGVVLLAALLVVSMLGVTQGGGISNPQSGITLPGSDYSPGITGNSAAVNVTGIIPSLTAQAAAAPSPGYYEGIVSYVTGNGSIYNGYGFASTSNSTSGPGFYQMPGVSDSALTLLVGASNLTNFFLGFPGFNVSLLQDPAFLQFMNLVPQETFLQVFPGNLSQSSSYASQSAASVESGLSVQLTKVLSISVPVNTTSNTNASIYLYTASASYSSFLDGFYSYSVNEFHTNGLLDVFKSKYQSGAFLPETNGMAGSIVFSGLINFNVLKEIFGSVSSLGSITNGSTYLSVLGGFTVDNYAIHSEGGMTNITLSKTLGYSEPIFFAPDSTASLLALGIPSTASNSTLIPGVNFTAYLWGNNQTLLNTLGLNVSALSGYSSTTGISPDGMQVSTNWLFPPDIIVHVSGKQMPSGIIELNTTVKNNGTVPVYNYNLNDPSFHTYYGNYTADQNGSLQLDTPLISPGQTVHSTYSFKPLGVGHYVLWNLTESYSAPVGNGSQNQSFTIAVNPVQVYAQPPFFLNAYNQVGYDSFLGIGNLLNVTFLASALLPGFYVFDLILVLIVALDVYIEYRAFMKYRNKGDDQTGSNGGT